MSESLSRFCATLLDHKTFTYEQYKLEFCFVSEDVTRSEVPLNEIQLYRPSSGYILFAVCQTSEELRAVLDEYAQIKHRSKNVYTHLFVRYLTNNETELDRASYDEKVINGDLDES
jgi:hypothetical protein